MGLGKTLQSICMLASDHHKRAEKYKETGDPGCIHTPSLVVCPPTLMQHWYHEIKNFAPFMKSLVYSGLPYERRKRVSSFIEYDVIITSYDIVRNDVAEIGGVDWNYCILDEG
jgi:TATA-binding protein-associated factor